MLSDTNVWLALRWDKVQTALVLLSGRSWGYYEIGEERLRDSGET
jgi:hypothetical protein